MIQWWGGLNTVLYCWYSKDENKKTFTKQLVIRSQLTLPMTYVQHHCTHSHIAVLVFLLCQLVDIIVDAGIAS